MKGLFITFEGTEGSGKSTQVPLLVERLREWGHAVCIFREPGGTPIGEEIRHTLKHSHANAAMTAEAELLLMNASRAQLVREIIRPALARGEIIICDRFFDSTTAYQGYGRQLNLATVRHVIDLAVGDTRPDLTLLLRLPLTVSEERLRSRQATMPFIRDRIEEADRAFFERVAKGYDEAAAAEPKRIQVINATGTIEEIQSAIWRIVAPLVATRVG
ncbi:MAG: dTMP kinase [Verrucomicrobia subdivision 3 bacterium]|nr:dTMP kinase [Limisphaerales bacterium]